MFEYLGTILVDIDPGFDVLRYLTVRTIGGTITALLLTIFLGPKLISWLQRMQFKQYGVERGPDSHKQKSGTHHGRITNNLLIANIYFIVGRFR